jgi:hypothetical protein
VRGLDVLVHEEGLGHRAGVGQARGLNHDGVEAALPLHQALQNPDQVAAHRAADAAVVHLEHFLVCPDHQVVVDADLAELVDDHGIALAVLLGEDAVEQGGLAGAEIAGQHGDGGSCRERERCWSWPLFRGDEGRGGSGWGPFL